MYVSRITSIFRSRSQFTTACTVALTSGNLGLVNIPMLLLFMTTGLLESMRNPLKGAGFYREGSFEVNEPKLAGA